jgi:hypothetical protein
MTVLIVIHFISSENKIMQRGSFPLKGKTKEVVAFEWWKQIRREMPYGGELEKVTANGEDITEKVKEMEKAPLE